jgi:signal transduction histidine kinase
MKCLCIFIACILTLQAKSLSIDSLQHALKTQTDTNEVKTLNELCYAIVFDDVVTAKQFGFKALEKAKKLNYTLGAAKACIRLGIAYDITSQYDSCIHYYNQALTWYNAINDSKGKASALNNLAMVYNNQGLYDKAVRMYFEALKAFETLKDTIGMANTLNNIAVLYNDTYKNKLALQYANQALKLYQAVHHKKGIAAVYTNISLSFNEINNDSIIYYGKKAIAIKEELNDQYGLGISYNDLGLAYNDGKKYDSALIYLNKSFEIKNNYNDRFGMASVLINRANTHASKQNYKQQLNDLLLAYNLAQEIKSYRLLSRISYGLSAYYKRINDYKNAYNYRSKYTIYKDSLMSEETTKQINELEARYQSEKKDLEIENKNLELLKTSALLSKKRTQLLLLIAVFVTLTLAALLFYITYNNRQKQKAIKLQVEQEQLRNIAVITAEDEERKRIAKDLHDGAGQQLSAIKMNLSALAHHNPDKALNNIMEQLDDAVKEVRNVSHMMMPTVLLSNGIIEAIKNLAYKINQSKQLNINTRFVDLTHDLDEKVQTTLYRIVQECFNNIIKHAQATEVNLQLIQHPKHLTLMIEDNGKGFNPDNKQFGMGLRNIESRVLYINGILHIDSSPGNGTTITIEIN